MTRPTFSDEGRRQLRRERFEHPHPRVQRRMEVLWLIRGGESYSSAARLAGVSDDWQDYYDFLPTVGRGAGEISKGRPRTYGKQRISLAHRGGHRHGWTTAQMTLSGAVQQVTWKTFLASYPPAGGVIRVVIVKRSPQLFGDCPSKWVAFFCTDPTVSAATILEAVADRSAIEQNFPDVKEVQGAGQQQVRNVWCHVACWNLCLWLHTLVELWSWRRSGNSLRQRDDRPWDDPSRRPSHADRLKTLGKQAFRETLSAPLSHSISDHRSAPIVLPGRQRGLPAD